LPEREGLRLVFQASLGFIFFAQAVEIYLILLTRCRMLRRLVIRFYRIALTMLPGAGHSISAARDLIFARR